MVTVSPEPRESRRLPTLDNGQLGHLQHIYNLANQPDGEWAKMGIPDPGQEWLDSYRYQLANMAYALGIAHYHWLPAAPFLFKPVFQRLIQKMLRRDVWGYWQDTSRSGLRINPDIKELREGWVDPVVKENIMFSGHLHAMTGMYAVLFDDDRYDEPGALTFHHAPIFWGMGPQKFEYNFSKLNDVIYWQMVESGWLGVACEPNCVFIVCNQFPILGFRFHDLRKGTKIAEEATHSYKAAWDDKGILTEDGNFIYFWRIQQDDFVPVKSGFIDAWTGSVMNTWNRDFIRSLYPQQSRVWLKPMKDGTISLHAPSVVPEVRKALREGRSVEGIEDRNFQWTAPDFGYAAMWASEIGDRETLAGLLAHADRHMKPTWDNGGLYYPRNDRTFDENGNLVFVDALTGNALLGYARLNVADGLWALYNKPWTEAHFRQPHLSALKSEAVLTAARYYPEGATLAFSLAADRPGNVDAEISVALKDARSGWSLRRDGQVVASRRDDKIRSSEALHIVEQSGELVIKCSVAASETFELTWDEGNGRRG